MTTHYLSLERLDCRKHPAGPRGRKKQTLGLQREPSKSSKEGRREAEQRAERHAEGKTVVRACRLEGELKTLLEKRITVSNKGRNQRARRGGTKFFVVIVATAAL